MFATIDRLIIAALLLKLQIFLLGQKVWLRERAYHALTRYSFLTGLVLRAADLDSDDVKAAIAAAVEEATAGLKDNNRKLLADLKKAKQGREIDPAELERLEGEVENLKTQLTAANKDLKTAKTAAEKASADLAAEQAATQRLLVDQGLTAALTEAGVTNPVMLKAAAAMLRAEKIEIATEGDSRVAKIGDKLLGDHVKAWASGDEGKAFVSAPNNGGGGAGGSGGGGGKVNPWAKDSLNMTEQGKLYIENPTLARSMAAEHGVTLP